jgi:hypothetical protein
LARSELWSNSESQYFPISLQNKLDNIDYNEHWIRTKNKKQNQEATMDDDQNREVVVDMNDVEQEGQPTQEEKAGEKKSGGMKLPTVNMADLASASLLPYVGVLFSGMVLLISLTSGGNSVDDHKYYEYGIAIAVVAMFFALVGWALSHSNLGDGKFCLYNNYFLFLWCFIGACFMTFGGPFEITGNGYFSSWGIGIFATMGLGVSADNVKNAVLGMGAMLGLLASSIIVIVAIASEGFDENEGELIYAIIVACITVLVLGGLIKMEQDNDGQPHKLKFPILAVFAILWIILACLVTFRGPFENTGNGYFGAWGGAVTGVFAAMAARGGDSGVV